MDVRTYREAQGVVWETGLRQADCHYTRTAPRKGGLGGSADRLHKAIGDQRMGVSGPEERSHDALCN